MEESKAHDDIDPKVYTARPRTQRMRRVPTPPPAPRRDADEGVAEHDYEGGDDA